MADSLDLDLLKKEYRNAIDGTSTARVEALKARDYYDGNQYTAKQKEIFAKRKQPPIVYNEIRRKCNGMMGFEITRRTDPIAYGRTDKDIKAANIASKTVRFVEEREKVDAKITSAFANMIVEGTGVVELTIKPSKNPREDDMDIVVRHVPWEMFYHDPRSRQADFSDASYMGVSEWMNLDEALTRYGKEHREKLEFSETGGDDLDEDYVTEDKPRFQWYDETRKRVRVVQHWRVKGGEWYFVTFTGYGIIEQGKSPYLDEDKRTRCPLRARSCYVDKENNRHGIVRDLFGPQDEINHRRSKMLHMISGQTFFHRSGVLTNKERTRAELKKPDGMVEVNNGELGKDFGFFPNDASLQGMSELYQDAKMQIDKQGLNPALLGRETGSASGRAILATQQGALAEEAPVFDALREVKLDIYETIWLMIKQFWTAERVIRITDDQKAPEYIGINQQVGQTIDGRPIVQNPVARIDVDLTIEETQDTPTIQAEQFERFMALYESVPAMQGLVDPVDILRMSDLPNKADVIERIERKIEQQQQSGPSPQEQMAMADAQANIQDTQAAAGLKQAQTAKIASEIGQQPPQEGSRVSDFTDAALKAAQVEKTRAEANKTNIEARILPFEKAHGAAIAEQQANQPRRPVNAL